MVRLVATLSLALLPTARPGPETGSVDRVGKGGRCDRGVT